MSEDKTILVRKKDTVIMTMCPNGGCPRMVLNRGNIKFRDDYKGEIKIGKLLSKISSL